MNRNRLLNTMFHSLNLEVIIILEKTSKQQEWQLQEQGIIRRFGELETNSFGVWYRPEEAEAKDMRVNVSINNYTLLTDLSITYEQITKGLSSKSSLKENEGMLFVLNSSSR
jgi:hypothetical protein